MHGVANQLTGAPNVLFGMDPLVVSLAIFVITYAVIVTERLNRAIVAMLGAGFMIFSGVLDQHAAFQAVDLNTISLLTGMMVIVAIAQKSGLFQYVAIVAAKAVKADPWRITLMLAVVTAVFSALLDNVTAVLLIAPVAILITNELDQKPYPYLFSIILASNIGGTATLIGDPPNIMIGSAADLTFMDFIANTAPVAVVVFVVTMVPIYFMWGRSMRASEESRAQVMAFNEREAITDMRLLKQSLFIIALTVFGFVAPAPFNHEPGTVAMFTASIFLLLRAFGRPMEDQSHETHRAFSEVEWVTIFFFVGLFIVVAGIERAGVLEIVAEEIITLTGGDLTLVALLILWASAVLSTIVDNIPFVATMIPVINNLGSTFSPDEIMTLWWSLSLGACLGGNGSLVGASANLVVAGFAERAGHRIGFVQFMLLAFPLMLVSIVISTAYVYLRYL
ncbi:MAG: ArsB/NhaD family transporter [Rhodobacteraceae bacterium]|nr:ArsB/NhaD family transporter [Paracoccaceae bacterium]